MTYGGSSNALMIVADQRGTTRSDGSTTWPDLPYRYGIPTMIHPESESPGGSGATDGAICRLFARRG